MQIKILFRGKNKRGEWLYGMPTCDFEYIFSDMYVDSVDQYRIDKKTVGQFTGLSDKNGIKIYEGDILLDFEIDFESEIDISGHYPVVYDSNNCQFAIDNSFEKDGSNLVNFVEYFGFENLEVVGNIYDNPELLK